MTLYIHTHSCCIHNQLGEVNVTLNSAYNADILAENDQKR